MKKAMKKLEEFLELGGIKKDITLLVIGGIALLLSIFHVSPLPFDLAWISIILCGVPIILEAGDESWKRQFHSANDPTGTVRRCRKNQNCGYRRPMGNLDRGDRTFRSNIYWYHFRRTDLCGNDSGCILSVCAGACDTDGNHGSDWKCNKARFSGQNIHWEKQ